MSHIADKNITELPKFVPQKRRYIFRRVLARVIDYSIVYLIVILAGSEGDQNRVFGAFLLYNLLFCFLGGATIGRKLVSVKVISDKNTILRAFGREILFWLLWWVVVFELLFSENSFVHERYSDTNLVMKKG